VSESTREDSQYESPRGGGEGAGAPDRGERPERPRRRGGGGGRFGRRRVCAFCVDKVHHIDYKEPAKLRRYVSDRAKIEPRRKTGTCAKHQRMLTLALKRARHVALLPYTAMHIQVTGVFPSRS
jgi:small subunit ribosomal protein S18